MAPAQNESQGTNPLLCKRSGYLNRTGSEGWESGPREGGSWNGVGTTKTGGQEETTALASSPQGWGEPGLERTLCTC